MGTPVYVPQILHPDFRDPFKRPSGPVEINWNNPLTRGLAFYPVWEGNNARCLVTGELGTVAGAGISQVLTPEGIALNSSGSSSVSFTKPAHVNGEQFTIITRFAWDGVTSADQGAVCLPSSDFGTMYIPDGSSLAWDTAGGGQTNMSFNSPQGDVVAGKFATWSIANHKHSSGNPGLFAYKNGARLTHGANNHTYAPTSGDAVRLFHGQSTHFAAGDMLFCALWTRQLSSAEQILFYENPYQLIQPTYQYSYAFGVPAVRSQVIAPFMPKIIDLIFRVPKVIESFSGRLATQDGVVLNDTGWNENGFSGIGEDFIDHKADGRFHIPVQRYDISDIPAGANIITATIEWFWTGWSSGGVGDVIYQANNIADCPTLDASNNSTGWTKTAASVTQTMPASGIVNEQPFTTSELKTILQELVDSYGGSLGEMGFSITPTGPDPGTDQVWSISDSSLGADVTTRLSVSWSVPSGIDSEITIYALRT